MVGRWRQLPLDRALSRMPSVRVVVQQLADLGVRGGIPTPVPQLGPEAVMDQLTVMVYDAFAKGPADAAGAQEPARPAQVGRLLADLRRTL